MTGTPAPPPAGAAQEATAPRALLEARHVSLRYAVAWNWLGRPNAWTTTVDDISLSVQRGETLGILGREGCGKSCLGRLLAGYEAPDGGDVLHGEDETGDGNPEPGPVQLVFSDPRSAVSPAMPVWRAITEPVALVEGDSPKALRAWAGELLYLAGLGPEFMAVPAADLSTVELQRLAIGRALSLDSQCLILDDPTRGLAVMEQAAILNLLLELQDRRRLGYVLLSRSPSMVKHMADRVMVMDRGRVVEEGPVDQVMAAPRHPFTRLWLAIDANLTDTFEARAAALLSEEQEWGPGPHDGCGFAVHCPWRRQACGEPQELQGLGGQAGRLVRCHRAAAGDEMPFD